MIDVTAAAGTTESPSDVEIRPISLRFASRALEREFIVEDMRRQLRAARLMLLAGLALYSLFGLLDYFIAGDAAGALWTIRYCIVGPILIGALLLSFTRYYIRVAQLIWVLCMLVSGAGIVAMTAIAPHPVAELYYAGLFLIVIYCASLVRLRWVYGAAVMMTVFCLYQLSAIWINPIAVEHLVNNDAFLGTCVVLAIYNAFKQELHVRRDFASARLALREKLRSDELLTQTQAASRAKSEFLAVMSHELRTPLNAIIGFTDIMRQRIFGPIGTERYVSYVDDIHQSGTHLLGIINDILDLSRAEAGKLTLSEETVDLGAIIDQCLRLVREKASEGGVRLAYDGSAGAAYVRADPRLVKQMLLNLVQNAIKFTPSGGSVAVSLAVGAPGSGHALRVTDTGIGIAAEDLDRIVEPFVQVQSALSRTQGGVGMGLPLVKKIVELHGGRLHIDSLLGAGTTVTTAFPADRTIVRPAERKRGAA
jgi:two-component system, cell cycle sensor histidine kinase PleC